MAVQNHIHLDITLGGAPENAPVSKWKVTERQEIAVRFINVKRTLLGYLRPNVLKEGGNPVALTNFRYRVKLEDDGVETIDVKIDKLKNMYGRTVYLVDNKHPDDGQNHASSVKTMFFAEMGSIDADIHKGLKLHYVDITLEDASRL